MSRAPDTWILTADCPSMLGTVDVVTRYLFDRACGVYHRQAVRCRGGKTSQSPTPATALSFEARYAMRFTMSLST